MNDQTDAQLLRAYAEHRSEPAFAALVRRHVDLVFSAAQRMVGDAHLAEDVAQVVFIILARKAASLNSKTVLPGWLCGTARNASANALREQQRRQRREMEAHMQFLSNEPESDVWVQMAPLLDSAMAQLGQCDHDALVLRFFQGKNFHSSD